MLFIIVFLKEIKIGFKQSQEYDIKLIKEQMDIDDKSILSHDDLNTTFVTNINDYFGGNFSFIRRKHSFVRKRPSRTKSSRSLISSLTS